MKIGITGPNGRLGSQLVSMGCIPMSCDLRSNDDIANTVSMINPDVIINCAAFTDVDACETSDGWKKAVAVNLYGIDRLRRLYEGRLIHLSTDYIFSGNRGPYPERRLPDADPINMYGASKLGGEVALLNPIDNKKETIIVRTTGLYGSKSRPNDVARLVVDTLSQGFPLMMTRELMGNQTYIPHLAEALIKLADMEWKDKILNIGSSDILSRYDFAVMVASIFGLDKNLLSYCDNKDITSWKARRPTKAGLKTTLAKRYHLPIYTVLDGLQEYKNV